MDDELLTAEEAADILGVSSAFLQRDRVEGNQVPFVQVGNRAVRYSRNDLQNYIDGRRHGPSSGVADGEYEDESEYEKWV